MKALVVVVLAAGCGDHQIAVDAPLPPPPEIDCIGRPPPTVANDPSVVDVTTRLDPGGGPNPGVAVEIRALPDDAIVASGTSDAQAHLSLSLPSGGHPLVADVHYTKPTYLGGNWFFPAYSPLVSRSIYPDLDTLATETDRVMAAGATYDPTKGALAIIVEDCARHGLAGVSITLEPASGFEAEADGPDGAGYHLFYNVDPGTLTINFAYAGFALTAQDVVIYPNEYTFTVLRP